MKFKVKTKEHYDFRNITEQVEQEVLCSGSQPL